MISYFSQDTWNSLPDEEKEGLRILASLFNADNQEELLKFYRVLDSLDPENME
ncbi:MAG: hypothetical protein N5P05_002752 [Chroococcopsis gigantea SAG 12.99]|jgi:TRAP-type C4-dicarboxylate transport system substrate-binding protein|nr:hypothetical protein [Chroococcopsis gigantea SAG 12.99]